MRLAIDYPIEAIVPHAGGMCLLERAIEGDAESLVAQLTIRPDSAFLQDDHVGGWVGVEYMAQAVAAWAGWHARLRGERPRIGFLLGTRRYQCHRPTFRLGEVLYIHVQQQFRGDNGLGQFDCHIEIDGETVASAALNVFEPDDANAFLNGDRHA